MNLLREDTIFLRQEEDNAKAFKLAVVPMNQKCGSGPTRTPEQACASKGELQTIQPFPSTGHLAGNKGVTLTALRCYMVKVDSKAYSYVVSSVKLNKQTKGFEQHGSAPNFQGDLLTLCTCKHQMRARRKIGDWKDVWVAGLTSRTLHQGKHWLFYLAKIKSAYESHADLWRSLESEIRNAKEANRHYLGDLFRPKLTQLQGNDRYSPSRYVIPATHTHRRQPDDICWHNDIKCHHATKYGYSSLLVADPELTFIWDRPTVYAREKHCRNYHTWSSFADLDSKLELAE